MSNVSDAGGGLPERIWLIPDAGNDGETVWCDDPAPGVGMDPDDAVEYRRADLCASAQVLALWPRWREMLLDEGPIPGAAIKEMDEVFAAPEAEGAAAMMTDKEISEFIADYGQPSETFLYLTPPQPASEAVAEAAKVLVAAWDADELPVSDPDPMLPEFIAALRALKGGDA